MYGGDGIVDPCADRRVAVLVHGEVVFSGGDEGTGRIEIADE